MRLCKTTIRILNAELSKVRGGLPPTYAPNTDACPAESDACCPTYDACALG